jgi:hypothetical protein
MIPAIDKLHTDNPDGYRGFLNQLQALFDRMDAAYAAVAAALDFECRGCADNCCRSLFYHHTYLEYALLMEGMAGLTADEQAGILARCGPEAERIETAQIRRESALLHCPLNQEERCRLYRQRPMICRLHGIPHKMRRPDGAWVTGPGCAACHAARGTQPTMQLDRTPFYRSLADLEREFRTACGLGAIGFKQPVARMLLL